MSQSEKKKKGLIVIVLAFIGVAAMAYFAISYQTQHNHRATGTASTKQTPKLQVVESVNPKEETHASAVEKTTPSLSSDTQLPNNIPPAMLEAMQERGMSIEDLRSGKGSSAMNAGKDSSAMNKGMSDNGIPTAMQKALAERDAANTKAAQDTPEAMKVETSPIKNGFPPYVYQAITHVGNHKIKEQIALLTRNMDILAFNPNDVQVLVGTADVFLKHNEIQAAQYLLERATIAAPSDAQVAYLYGLALSKSFESEKAAAQWERSIRIQDTPRVRLDLALLYRYQLNKAELAKQNLEKALTLPDLSSSLRSEIQRELDR